MEPEPTDEAIRAKLEALVAANPSERKTKLELTLDPHRDLIVAAIAKGHPYRAITNALRDAGLKESPETIRRYVQKIASNGEGKAKRGTRRVTFNGTKRVRPAPQPSSETT